MFPPQKSDDVIHWADRVKLNVNNGNTNKVTRRSSYPCSNTARAKEILTKNGSCIRRMSSTTSSMKSLNGLLGPKSSQPSSRSSSICWGMVKDSRLGTYSLAQDQDTASLANSKGVPLSVLERRKSQMAKLLITDCSKSPVLNKRSRFGSGTRRASMPMTHCEVTMSFLYSLAVEQAVTSVIKGRGWAQNEVSQETESQPIKKQHKKFLPSVNVHNLPELVEVLWARQLKVKQQKQELVDKVTYINETPTSPCPHKETQLRDISARSSAKSDRSQRFPSIS